MVNRKKKYEAGAAQRYITRKSAMKKLQLTLKDFRKLCILKGIYPREPSNRRKAQKGKTGIKTLYHAKDIKFLSHEPLIWKLREFKIFAKRMGTARATKNFEKIRQYLESRPHLKVDHIVKERYPTFIDAVRDMDDCLTLCFMFSTFPSIKHVRRDFSSLCRRLTVEFMHYVMAARALRKVFISIKGYYFQADISGQTVTWIVPHVFPFKPESKDDVDFKIMASFVEFYTVMLGFINFKLYHSLNLYYPPKFPASSKDAESKILVDQEAFVSERIAALNLNLLKSDGTSNEYVEEEFEMDDIPLIDDPDKIAEIREEREKVKRLKTLFKGLKVFVNREVPREPVVFVLRCFGAEVSWDPLLFVGSTFDEHDTKITHQIIDRPSLERSYLSRYYVQPQWVFDCVNARKLLPEVDYLMGKTLPPHLSPFTTAREGQYQPPEEQALREGVPLKPEEAESEEGASEDEEENSEDNGSEDATSEEESGEEDEAGDSEEEISSKDKKVKEMAVIAGEVTKENPRQKQIDEAAQLRLRERMIARKHRKLYRSMMKGRRKREQEVNLLKKKRKVIEEESKKEKKTKKKQAAAS
ncbi:pescadillo homolog [Neocloeon triangulifer]|uniref:pescadillo homolog n=1 Tax=Neocloeon triangulifer TaxID=2078957 RepID=UPI00286F9BA8|nr:pescadillo homolog [Neocloeon triangulifer]